jgi:hypothetical protein
MSAVNFPYSGPSARPPPAASRQNVRTPDRTGSAPDVTPQREDPHTCCIRGGLVGLGTAVAVGADPCCPRIGSDADGMAFTLASAGEGTT